MLSVSGYIIYITTDHKNEIAMSEIIRDCLKTTLKGSATGNLPKPGDYVVKLTNMASGNIYCMRFNPSDTNTLTVSDNAYFCNDHDDDTPILSVAADSRSVTLNNTKSLFLYVVSGDSVQMTISDKYSFSGIGYHVDYGSQSVTYTIPFSDLCFMSNWSAFSKGKENAFAEYPIPVITGGYRCFTGDISNTKVLYKSFFHHLDLSGITGTLHIEPTVSIMGGIILSGDYSFDITNLSRSPNGALSLYSAGVTGSLGTLSNMAERMNIGTSDKYTTVTIDPEMSTFPASKRFTLYSNSVTASMLKTLTANALALIQSQTGSTHLTTFIVKASPDLSPQLLTLANIRAVSGLVDDINALRQVSTLTTLTINDLDLDEL